VRGLIGIVCFTLESLDLGRGLHTDAGRTVRIRSIGMRRVTALSGRPRPGSLGTPITRLLRRVGVDAVRIPRARLRPT
jgi:hypothetical protein